METVLMMERKGHCKCAAGKPDCPDYKAEGGDDTPPLLVREPDTERSSLAGEHTRQRPRRRLVSSQRMKDLAKTFALHHPVFQPSLDEREYQYQDFSGPKSCVADKYFDYHSEDVLMLGPRPGLEGSCQPETGQPETQQPEPLQPETGHLYICDTEPTEMEMEPSPEPCCSQSSCVQFPTSCAPEDRYAQRSQVSQSSIFKKRLWKRRRNKGESLHALYFDIMNLASLAWPEGPSYEDTTVEAFINALDEPVRSGVYAK